MQSKVNKELKLILEKAGLPKIRFPDLMHTSISILLGIGTPVNKVKNRVGHSKLSVATDIYGHAMAHSQEEAAEKIEEMITPIPVELQ